MYMGETVMEPSIDISYVRIQPEHALVHDELVRWARWSRSRPIYQSCRSLEGNYRSPQIWYPEPPKTPMIIKDVLAVEKAVVKLPASSMQHIKFWYLERRSLDYARRSLGLTQDGAIQHINRARSMVRNLMRIGFMCERS